MIFDEQSESLDCGTPVPLCIPLEAGYKTAPL